MSKIILIVCLVVLGFATAIYLYQKKHQKSGGIVIILNGPSSVGKSTIQKAVQASFNEPYLRMGLDDLAFLPNQYISVNGPVSPADQGIWLETSKQDGHQVVTIHYGPVGQKMICGIHKTFAVFAQTGNNIVVDYILYDRSWLPDLVKNLKNCQVYFIGVNAPLAVIEEREKSRGNRLLGHARSHYDTVHQDLVYDLEIDSSKTTPEESAKLIQDFIKQNPKPKAFKKN